MQKYKANSKRLHFNYTSISVIVFFLSDVSFCDSLLLETRFANRVWKGGGGGGGGGLDLESRAKFPYIHESRNFFFRFHESNEVDFWICSQTFTSSDFYPNYAVCIVFNIFAVHTNPDKFENETRHRP